MSTTDWTPPGWALTEVARDFDGWRSVRMACRAEGCTHKVFTALPAGAALDPTSLDRDHQEQHRPGRALDIEVDWAPHARCSVCSDGIGTIEQDDDGLACRECGTTWDLEGTMGEIDDERTQ